MFKAERIVAVRDYPSYYRTFNIRGSSLNTNSATPPSVIMTHPDPQETPLEGDIAYSLDLWDSINFKSSFNSEANSIKKWENDLK